MASPAACTIPMRLLPRAAIAGLIVDGQVP
jgi:hypothetical protein